MILPESDLGDLRTLSGISGIEGIVISTGVRMGCMVGNTLQEHEVSVEVLFPKNVKGLTIEDGILQVGDSSPSKEILEEYLRKKKSCRRSRYDTRTDVTIVFRSK